MEQIVGTQAPAKELRNLAVILGRSITLDSICPPGTDQNIVADVPQAVVNPVNGRAVIILPPLSIPAIVQLDSEDGAMSREMIQISLGNIKGGSGLKVAPVMENEPDNFCAGLYPYVFAFALESTSPLNLLPPPSDSIYIFKNPKFPKPSWDRHTQISKLPGRIKIRQAGCEDSPNARRYAHLIPLISGSGLPPLSPCHYCPNRFRTARRAFDR